MTDLRRAIGAALWTTLFLVCCDVARVPARAVPSSAGWRHLSEVVALGLVGYGAVALAFMIGATAVARWTRARVDGAGGMNRPVYAGAAAGLAAGLLLLGMLAERRGAPSWFSSAWLVDAQMALVLAASTGWAASGIVSTMRRRQRARMWLAAALLIPFAPPALGAFPVLHAAGLPFGRSPAAPSRANLPDIVVLLADTLRADALSSYGGRLTTPAIDSLAADGVRFDDVTTQASWTNPSTATILTSREPSEHGVIGYRGRLRADVRTLAEVLASRGYRTAGLVANPVLSRTFGFDRGFEHWDQEPDHHPLAVHTSILLARLARAAGLGPGDVLHAHADEMVGRALAVLSDGDDRPTFLYLHLMDPHDPYTPPDDLARASDPGYAGRLAFEPGTLYAILRGELPVTEADLRHAHALYEAEVVGMDRELGRLIDALRRRGRPAIVIFTSDHGEEFMDHGAHGHEHTLYQELIQVPLIAARLGGPAGGGAADLPAGAVVELPVRSLDIAPTLLDLAALAPEESFRGRSLLPLVRREAGAAAAEDPLFSEEDYVGYRTVSHQMRSARVGPWKVILYRPNVFGIGPWRREVFDIGSDPREAAALATGSPEADRIEAWLRERISKEARPEEGGELDPETERRLRALGYIQ